MAPLEETITLKPEKFSGQNFRRWQRQMRYWLTILGLVSALKDPQAPSMTTTTTTTPPTSTTKTSVSQASSSKMTIEQIDYHCHNRILSALVGHLYDVYQNTTSSAKEIWKA